MCDIFIGISKVNAASSPSVTVRLSSEQVKKSSSVTLTAEVRTDGSIKNTGYSFSFGYNTDGGTRYSAFGYQSSSVYTFQPQSIDSLKNYTGPVYIMVWAKNNSTGAEFSGTQKILNIIPDDEELLRASGSVTSTGSYTVGDRLLVTMTASGGKSPYKYKYEYAKSGGGYSTYKDYSSASSITMATDSWTANTDYNIRVTVKDSNNDTFSYVSAVRLSAKPVPTPSISSFSVQSTAGVGDKIKLNCDVKDGTKPYQYKYTYINPSNQTKVIKDYSTSDNVTWNTSSLSAGSYTVKVTVKDKNDKTASQKATVTLTVSTPSITSFSVPGTAQVGEKVKLNCDVKDGTKPYQYKFTYINPSNQTKVIKDYSTSDNVTWNTSSLSDGSYTVKVEVKDKNNKTASQKATIKLSKTPTLSPTISTNPSDGTVVKGKDITFTVDTHSDGSESYPPQPYNYKFEYKKKNASSYTTLKDYSDNEKYKYNTKDLSAGEYVLKATVKDKNGKVYSKTCNFTVSVPKITFSISPGSKEFYTGGGDEKAVVEVKDVKGGISDEYEYKFEYVKYGELTDTSLTPPENDAEWQSIKDFSSESTADFTVNDSDNAGIYAVRVSVQNKDNDDDSLIYRKIIKNYTVKVKVEHTLADINTLINKIDTWYSNSVQGDMEEKLKNWSSDNDHYSEYPFSYEDYSKAYFAALNSNFDGNTDYDKLYSDLETQFRKLQNLVNSGYVSPELDKGDSPIGFVNSYFDCYKYFINGINDCFLAMAGNPSSDGGLSSTFFSFDFDNAVNTIFNIFKVFAYSIVIILAGVNALESALQYEMFTMRGGVKILARLVFAKIWVDLSLVICRSIIKISMDLLLKITSLTDDIMSALNIGIHIESSNIWVIGWLVDFFNGALICICVSLVLLPLLILVIAIYIKLFIRLFDLSLLQTVSPVFFACLTGESTKQYFRKFIMTYISVVVEVLFMAVIWYFYIQYTGSLFTDNGLTINNIADIFGTEFLSLILVSFAVSILVLKPPRILKSLVE